MFTRRASAGQTSPAEKRRRLLERVAVVAEPFSGLRVRLGHIGIAMSLGEHRDRRLVMHPISEHERIAGRDEPLGDVHPPGRE